MKCPYFDEGNIGICSVSVSRHVPNLEKMETYCFKKTYRLCPNLSEYLYENDMTTADCSPGPKLSRCEMKVSS